MRDISERSYKDKYDFVILSGVFHQIRNIKRKEWEDFSYNLLQNAFKMCKYGLAFNFVSPFVDFYQENFYYCDLIKLLHMINDKMSRFFVINHSYPLYEFTVFIYPENIIREKNSFKNLNKYFEE